VNDPCILFALSRESEPFRQTLAPAGPIADSPCSAQRFGEPTRVVVVETGVGQANVARALDWLLAKPLLHGIPYSPSRLIFAGYAGALSECLRAGDVMIASEVIDEHGHVWPTTWPTKVDVPRGRLLTVNQLTATPDEKSRLREKHGAVAVDMESAVFAARCTQAGLPFGCVRAISDDAATGLSPSLVSLLEGGTVSPWRAFWAMLCRPWLAVEFWRLARDSSLASERLAVVLHAALLEAHPPENSPDEPEA